MGPRGRRLVALFVGVFQVFAIVSAFQLSSVGHFASDVVQLLVDGRHHHDVGDDDEDQPGHECPAGCPNCHHVHAGGASLPNAAGGSVSSLLPAGARPRRALDPEQIPLSPSLPSLYRPPRA